LRSLPGLRARDVAQLATGQISRFAASEVFIDDRQQGIRRYLLAGYGESLLDYVSAGIQRDGVGICRIGDFVMRRSLHFGGLHTHDRLSEPLRCLGGPVHPEMCCAQALDPKALCSTGGDCRSRTARRTTATRGLHVRWTAVQCRYLFVGSYALSKYTGFNSVGNGPINATISTKATTINLLTAAPLYPQRIRDCPTTKGATDSARSVEWLATRDDHADRQQATRCHDQQCRSRR